MENLENVSKKTNLKSRLMKYAGAYLAVSLIIKASAVCIIGPQRCLSYSERVYRRAVSNIEHMCSNSSKNSSSNYTNDVHTLINK